jgi:hypothetical protein
LLIEKFTHTRRSPPIALMFKLVREYEFGLRFHERGL